jgi:hypothetical protein
MLGNLDQRFIEKKMGAFLVVIKAKKTGFI